MPTRILLAPLIWLAFLVPFFGTAANAADARPGAVRIFHLPTCEMNTGLIAGPRRGVLLSLCDKKGGFEGSVVANLLPDGRLIRYRVPRSEPGPMAVGPNGEIWAVRTLDKKSFPTKVFRIGADGTRESFSIDQVKGAADPYSELRTRDLVVDGDGTAWLATADLTNWAYIYNSYGGDLVRIAPGSPVEAFPLPQGEPENLTVGTDGNLWFTAISGKYSSEHSSTPGTGFIGRLTTAGEFTLFPTPIAHGEPEAIATAPDGTLWFTETAARRVATIGLDGNFGRDYRVRFGYLGNPEITARQGGLVFDRLGDALIPAGKGGVGRLTPGGVQTRYPGPPSVRSVAVGREGDIWFLSWKEIRRIARGAF